MPRFKEHLTINLTALIFMEVRAQKLATESGQDFELDLRKLIRNVAIGAFGGALPDILEPSLGNPNHRGFCHSLASALGVWWLASGKHTEDFPKEMREMMAAFSSGCSFHLLADLFLSKGKGMGLVGRSF